MKNYDYMQPPAAEIKIGISKWQPDKIFLSRVHVSLLTNGGANTCYLEFESMNLQTGKDKLEKIDSDFKKVKLGEKLEVSLGYFEDRTCKKKNVKSVFSGYISSYDIKIIENEKTIFTIHGMDARMWMMANRDTKYFPDKKYSEIVKQIAKQYKFKITDCKIKIENEPNVATNLYQRNESDYEFLRRIAGLTGCIFYIADNKFYFISPSSISSAPVSLPDNNAIQILSFSANMVGIPKTVIASDINAKDYKKSVSDKATKASAVGKGDAFTKLTCNNAMIQEFNIPNDSLYSKQDLEFVAAAEMNKRALNLATCRAQCSGQPDVEIGTKFKVNKFGKPFDNSGYIVTSVEHNFTGKEYTTNIKLSANKFEPI